ncbi:MAG: hypothetical protein CL484_08850 [Acidobacteria bacterium]|mgnify:CR=1 FL=1|nr:hypothetical protein [Acidobacteriota bacterium]|tara:strand:- start:607 stop:3759 length:3153 start_codon:yes stop_codon:yes gene_type:complete
MYSMVEWFARNSVAANLLMVLIVVTGVITVFTVNEEIMPEIELDRVVVEVPYLGAAPEEVESAVCVRIEEAIQGIDGIKEIQSTAAEGMGVVVVELELGADARKVVDDIKTNVDAITTFPVETEKPVVRELTRRIQVTDVAVTGVTDPLMLKSVAERVRDELTTLPGVTYVELVSAPPYEISIEVSEVALRRHGLTFDQVADAVRGSSLDLPGGAVRTEGGEILLRTIGQVYRGQDYENLMLWTQPDGSRLLLGDVANVVDGFAETDQFARFDVEPTIMVSVFRTGDQSTIDIAASVQDYVDSSQERFPQGVTLTVWRDTAQTLGAQQTLMFRNGLTGFVLVFVVLTLFLELRLAFWVSLGIPISFLGAIAFMPILGVSVNMMSLFAFILVLGIIVDDAIIVGENIFRHQEGHGDSLRGSIEGGQEIAKPVVFAVLTTVAAFSPLMFVPGMMGKMFRVIPLIVIPCLLFSLVESLNILPAHLSHRPNPGRPGRWRRIQARFADGLKLFAQQVYQPFLEVALKWRYLTVATAVATMILTIGLVLSGRPSFQFFPSVEANIIMASVTMPQGTPVEVTSRAVAQLEAGAARFRQTLLEETGQDYIRHLSSAVGDQPMAARRAGPGSAAGAGHLGEVLIELIPSETRTYNSEQLGNMWRELTGQIPEAVDVNFNMSMMGPGEDIDVQLAGPDLDELQTLAADLKGHLAGYPGVYDISDSFRPGKAEMKLGIKPAAEILGLTLEDLGRQVRQAFYGEEAQRIQRARDDVRVMVRYPRDGRRSLGDLTNMRIRTPDGGEVPFSQVATVEPGRGFAAITRVDRNRAVNVTAAVDPDVNSSAEVAADLQMRVLPELLEQHAGVFYAFGGAQAEVADGVGGLQRGFTLALLVIFALLAVPLKSYVQPLIIMSAIPFGLVGAVWGHLFMGLDVTMMSMFGLVALAGVVVNDSLIMVDFINRQREVHSDIGAAVREAGLFRFRPIVLTSFTTFFGLVPLMLDRSFDAAMVIPMAVSLAWGVLFATAITLILVPTIYVILEDFRAVTSRLAGRGKPIPVASS